ncbi:MAG TPA: glutaredoxin [Candidatus Deferrimicrobium sp.]|nr:glutaredoxin [Candidatus Deferrimicrobium sp.]
MNIKTVLGNIDRHDVMLYTISTCIWCLRLKNKLISNKIKYRYVDIDLEPLAEKEKLKAKLSAIKPRLAFPMMFVDDEFIPNEEIDQQIEELIRGA